MTMFPAITNLAIHSRYANDNAVYRIDWDLGRQLYEQSEMGKKYPVWQSCKWHLALGDKIADDADLYLDKWLDANGFRFVEEREARGNSHLYGSLPYNVMYGPKPSPVEYPKTNKKYVLLVGPGSVGGSYPTVRHGWTSPAVIDENQAALCRRIRAGSPYEFAIWEVRVYGRRGVNSTVAA